MSDQIDRFSFGKNWASFLLTVNEERIRLAEETLCDALEIQDLDGVRLLDIGCGSGLFSLAARRLGAEVHSFDFDEDSVTCTQELRRRYLPDDKAWLIERGSVLDDAYLESLGQWDVVYSWGVLHHTGDMYGALDNVAPLVANNGKLFISIYNDEGYKSRGWAWVKQTYNQRRWTRGFLLAYGFWHAWGLTMIIDLVKLQPFKRWREYYLERGMSGWHDVVDWVGGWPFEVATPEAIFEHFSRLGFKLNRLRTLQGKGCNEFVFLREPP
ncbi:MAG: methyltransferase [Pseudomonadales bacterium]|nr:methyltransferase [Pseudomonadales bacterium]